MTNTPETGWPKTSSGAIDWALVFEDSKTGLIPLIRQAHSSTALRECMIAVVTRLYVRKDDPSEVERFVAQLKTMIPDQVSPRQLSRLAGTMEDILRQIKAERIRLASAFESAKAAPAAAPAAIADMPKAGDDRRSKFEPTPLVALAKAAVARRLKKIALTAASIVGAVLIAGIMIDSYLEAAPQREAKRKAAELLDQIQAASQGTPIGTHVYGGAIYIERTGERAAVVVEGLSPDQCAHAGWMLAKTGGVSVGGYAPGNASLNAFRALCTAAPGGATLTWIPRLGSGAKK